MDWPVELCHSPGSYSPKLHKFSLIFSFRSFIILALMLGLSSISNQFFV